MGSESVILLDTHVWVWWIQDDSRLSVEVKQVLDAMSPGEVAVSAISFWEVALLTRHHKLVLPDSAEVWLQIAASDPRLIVLPIDQAVSTRAALLPEIHKDPADRFLIAHAVVGGHTLITEDARILSYDHVDSIRPVGLLGRKA